MEALFDLNEFNSYREDNRREVKKAEGGLPKSLWDTYSSMANTYGGVIICGIGERADGSWYTTGLKNVNKRRKEFWDTINSTDKVSVNLLKDEDVSAYEVNGDGILVINVPAADRDVKPVYIGRDMFRGTFKRNHEGDYHCTKAEIQAMLRDQPRITMDMKLLDNLSIDDYDQDSVKNYRVWFESEHPGHAWNKMNNSEFLEMIGAAKVSRDDTLRPTGAGLLMFGKEYKILYEYPLYFLDYREHLNPKVRWTDRVQSQSADWSGNVFDFFVRVSSKLTVDLKKPFKLVNMVRVDETPIHEAVREALVNCIVNTDFYEARGVVIQKYPDRIILQNPGSVIVGKKQMLKGGISEPRNSGLMKMFNLIGYGEKAGSGVPDIFSTWEDAGYQLPTVEELFGPDQPNRTVVTLPLVDDHAPDHAVSEKGHEKGHEKGREKGHENKNGEVEKRMISILGIIRENPQISIIALADMLGESDKKVRTAIDALKKNGIIHRVGPAKGGSWVIDKNPKL